MQLTLVDPTAIITWLTQNGLKVKNDLSPVLTELNVRCVLDLASLDIEGTNKVVSVMKNLQQKKWSKCKVPEKLAAILTTAIDEANKKITVEEWLQVLALSDSGTADWLEEEGYEDMEDLMELEEEEMEKLITAAKKNGGEAHAKVMACGENDSFEAYRGLYVQGRDISTRHKLVVKTKAMNPERVGSLEDVEVPQRGR